MKSLSDEVRAQDAVALQNHRDLGAVWAVCEDVYVEAGGAAQLSGVVTTADGQTEPRPVPSVELIELWGRLREVMALPDKGVWFTGRLRSERSGRYRFHFEWDERPLWPEVVGPGGVIASGRPVEVSGMLEDLALHPRTPRYTPGWVAHLPSRSDVEFKESATPPGSRALTADPQWAAVIRGGQSYVVDFVLDDQLPFMTAGDVANIILADLLGHLDASQLRSMLVTARRSGLLGTAPIPPLVEPTQLARELTGQPPAGSLAGAFRALILTLTRQILDRVVDERTS